MGLANGGQILITEPIYDELKKNNNYRIRYHGEYRLKGLEKKVKIYELLW